MTKHGKKLQAGQRIGLALGGGGARGWSHIGVLRAIQERELEIAAVAGTSIGALVGGFAAVGKLDVLEELAGDLDLKRILYLFAEGRFHRSGLVDGRKIIDLVREHVGQPDIDRLPIPFRAVATDIDNGQEVVLEAGDLVQAIRASIAIPGIFSPVEWNGRYLVDGGLVNPLPIRVVREMGADTVIAVDLQGDGWQETGARREHARDEDEPEEQRSGDASSVWVWLEEQRERVGKSSTDLFNRWTGRDPSPSILAVLTHTVDIVSAQRTAVILEETPPDILIQPDVRAIGYLEFQRAETAIEAGYRAAVKALDGHG